MSSKSSKENSYVSSQQNPKGKPAVLILTSDNFNELEFFYPYYRLNEAGLRVDVATIDGKEVTGADKHSIPETLRVKDARVEDYDLLYIPGGKAPQTLRQDADVLNFTQEFFASGKPVAMICHGAQVAVSADIVKGKRLTAYPEVESEIKEAGGTYVNEPLVEDKPFITSRWPGDLPMHLHAVLECLGIHGEQKKSRAA